MPVATGAAFRRRWVLLPSSRPQGYRRREGRGPAPAPGCLLFVPPLRNTVLDISDRYIGASLLELAILGLLKEQELHGYELKKRLAETLGQFSGVSFGSLYPALARLEAA